MQASEFPCICSLADLVLIKPQGQQVLEEGA